MTADDARRNTIDSIIPKIESLIKNACNDVRQSISIDKNCIPINHWEVIKKYFTGQGFIVKMYDSSEKLEISW